MTAFFCDYTYIIIQILQSSVSWEKDGENGLTSKINMDPPPVVSSSYVPLKGQSIPDLGL
jgi:hypothetical protein